MQIIGSFSGDFYYILIRVAELHRSLKVRSAEKLLGSSEAERLAVNEDVAGSIPARAVLLRAPVVQTALIRLSRSVQL